MAAAYDGRHAMKEILSTAIRLLGFRATTDELRNLNYGHLAFGLVCTWLAGMGRWWEDPKAGLLQHLGIGSVAYVFILAFFLWLLLWPLVPPQWSFSKVLIFVSLTAPPALLYAIPVRHGLDLQTAQTVRLWLLAIVAGWRVALLAFYLHRGSGLSGFRWLLAVLFPLLLIIFMLTALNLERVVFDIMGGIHAEDRTVNDGAYGVLFLLSLISVILFLPLLPCYLVCSAYAVIGKYGPGSGRLIYGLALALVVAGAGLNFYDLTFFSTVLIGSGIVLALSAKAKLDQVKNP